MICITGVVNYVYVFLNSFWKWTRLPQEGVSLPPDESSDLESALSIPDVDSTTVPLLQSQHVRNRLASLATLHLKRKKKVIMIIDSQHFKLPKCTATLDPAQNGQEGWLDDGREKEESEEGRVDGMGLEER